MYDKLLKEKTSDDGIQKDIGELTVKEANNLLLEENSNDIW